MNTDCAPDCDERTDCPDAGKPNHWQCGRCPVCLEPIHHSGCIIQCQNPPRVKPS